MRRHAQDDPKYLELLRIKNPKSRLRKFVDACKGKVVCPETGQLQPSFRVDAGKIHAEYKERKSNADDPGMPEPADRKQVRLGLFRRTGAHGIGRRLCRSAAAGTDS